MKKILFIHPGRAHLPELSVYPAYIPEYEFFDCQDFSRYSNKEFDLLWYFMGLNFHRDSLPTIHEYASSSVGSWAGLKDMVKKKFSAKPDLRIFLNRTVAATYAFQDGVPYCYRDMGVHPSFFDSRCEIKRYDFVYVGSMDMNRHITILLDWFKQHPGITALLIGKIGSTLYEAYRSCKNMFFTGSLRYTDVPKVACEAEYAINYIPNIYPYNIQTSTKLLEYVAMGLKVITTRYPWADMFEQNRHMHFFKVSEDLHELQMASLEKYNFVDTDIVDLSWENVIANSEIRENLARLLGKC